MNDLAGFINRHLNMTKPDDRIEYKKEEVAALLERVKPIFGNESSLVEVTAPVTVVGDIHGQFFDLRRIFSCREVGPPPPHTRYLFLGDYVDRGPRQLEVICLLLALKTAHPDRIYLLRGNHECMTINRTYGFLTELTSRFPQDGPQLWQHFNDVFAMMPLAGLISSSILCMHGGLSEHLTSLDDIRNIQRPCPEPRGLALDLLWSDPARQRDNQGFSPNAVRQISVSFGRDVVKATIERLGITMIVRAHQVVQHGYQFFAEGKLLTLFSAPRYYAELNNKGAVLNVYRAEVDDGKGGKVGDALQLYIIMFNPVTAATMNGPDHPSRRSVSSKDGSSAATTQASDSSQASTQGSASASATKN